MQSKLIKAAGMTTCPAHRPRQNSHAVGSRFIAAELWKAAEKENALSLVSPEIALLLYIRLWLKGDGLLLLMKLGINHNM